MDLRYQLLYNDMLESINRALSLDLPELECIETCFWIANNYWERLKELRHKSIFASEAEEIDFFKNVKPQFTGRIGYYTIVYEAVFSQPENCKKILPYWYEETKRLEYFSAKNELFVTYYETDAQFMDRQYYLRANKDASFVLATKVYDADVQFCAAKDTLLAKYISHKLYHEFVQERIARIKSSFN